MAFNVIKINNDVTGDSYIAYTSKKPKVALLNLKAHAIDEEDSIRTIHLGIRAYGEDKFSVETLDVVEKEETAKSLRNYFSIVYNSVYNKRVPANEISNVPFYIKGYPF